MDKKQLEKIEIIKNYLPKCSTWNVFVYGKIPKDRYYGACSAYAGNVNYENVIGLIDETVWSSGKKGCLFTFDGFYYDGCKEMIRYDKGITWNSFRSYNLATLNEMLKKLYEVETRKSVASEAWDLFKFIGGIALDSYVDNLSKKDENNTSNSSVESLTDDRTELEEKEQLMKKYREAKKNARFLSRLSKILEESIENCENDADDADISELREFFEKGYIDKARDIEVDMEEYLENWDDSLIDLMINFEENMSFDDCDDFLDEAYDFQEEIDKITMQYDEIIKLIKKQLKDDFDFEV